MCGWVIALSVLWVMCAAGSTSAERRVAFVVGNGAYASMQHLANAPGDAKAVAAMLEKMKRTASRRT